MKGILMKLGLIVCIALLCLPGTAHARGTRVDGIGLVVAILPDEYDSQTARKLEMLESKIDAATSEGAKRSIARKITQTKSNWSRSGDKVLRIMIGNKAKDMIWPITMKVGRKRLQMEPGKYYELNAEYQLDNKHQGHTFTTIVKAVEAMGSDAVKFTRYKPIAMPAWWPTAKISKRYWDTTWLDGLDPTGEAIRIGSVVPGESVVSYRKDDMIDTGLGSMGHQAGIVYTQKYEVLLTNQSGRNIDAASISCSLIDQNSKEYGPKYHGRFHSWPDGESRSVKFTAFDTSPKPGLTAQCKVVVLRYSPPK
jgi:hypothetical protein